MRWRLLLLLPPLLEVVRCIATPSQTFVEVQTAQHLHLHRPGYLSEQKSESLASAMVHKGREQVNAEDAISHMQQALKLLDEVHIDSTVSGR